MIKKCIDWFFLIAYIYGTKIVTTTLEMIYGYTLWCSVNNSIWFYLDSCLYLKSSSKIDTFIIFFNNFQLKCIFSTWNLSSSYWTVFQIYRNFLLIFQFSSWILYWFQNSVWIMVRLKFFFLYLCDFPAMIS